MRRYFLKKLIHVPPFLFFSHHFNTRDEMVRKEKKRRNMN